jgi:hypothetical protein
LSQLHARVFAFDQESDGIEVYQRDLAQIQSFWRTAITHCQPEASDVIRLDPAAE